MQELEGLSFKNDLELINDGGGAIIIISQKNEPVGFLAYYPMVFIHLWEPLNPQLIKKEVLMKGLSFYREINHQK
jgi:hypothetical protein